MTTAHARMITVPQSKLLHVLLRDLHVTSREEKLARIGRYIGRDIASTTQLSQDEATYVLEWLKAGGD